MYELKPNVADFEVVDGLFAGRKYKAGELYKEVPPEEEHKFNVTGGAVEPTSSPLPGGDSGVGISQEGN